MLLIVCVVGCLEGFVAERLTWRLGKGHSLVGEDGGPRKGGAQAEGELRRSLGAGRRCALWGSTRGGDGASQQCLWPGPASSFLLRSPPHPLNLLSVYWAPAPALRLGGTRGDQDIASTLDRAGGSCARCPSGSAPPAPAPGKLGGDMVWGPASILVWREPHLQLQLPPSRSKGQSPPLTPQQLFCRVAPVGRTSVSRVDLPPLE